VEPMQTYSVASARERLRTLARMACAAIRSDTRLPRGMSRLARRMAFPGMAGWRRRAGLAVAAAALLFGAVSSCGSAAGYDRGRGATSVLVGHQPLWRHRLASGWAYLIGQRGSAR
jgi:hypothetical protein